MAAQNEASAEIEVTPEMAAAGGNVLEQWLPGAGPTGYCRSVAEDVFTAMQALAPDAGPASDP